MEASLNANAGTSGGSGGNTPERNLDQVRIAPFNAASQFPLHERLNDLVVELDNMAKLSDRCNIQVPVEVINLIDDGKNPDEFTRDVINTMIATNQITKGKTDSFKSLRTDFLEELDQAFPDEVEKYKEIRTASAAALSSFRVMRK